MRGWTRLSVLPGNTLKQKRKKKKSAIVPEMLRESENQLFWQEAVCLVPSCTCSRLLSFYLCCLLLLSVRFAVYGVPASVMNVSTSCTTCTFTHGGARAKRKHLPTSDQSCCCRLLATAERREGGESALHPTQTPSSSSSPRVRRLSVQHRFFNYNHFSMTTWKLLQILFFFCDL